METSAQPMRLSNAEEGVRLARAAKERGCLLRLFGGVAVWLLCPSARHVPLAREYADVDFATLTGHTREVTRFLESEGYQADRLFNSLHGASRMRFENEAAGRSIDVIVDRFVQCHTIDLRRSLSAGLTVPLTELLVMKLQIIRLNEKDLRDIAALLADHAIGTAGEEVIDSARLALLTRDDWGLEHTMRRTLAQVSTAVQDFGVEDDIAHLIEGRIAELVHLLDSSPKSVGWRLRAQIGERMRWYEIPEEASR